MKLLASSVRPYTASPQIKLFVVFAIAYCIATQYLRAVSSRDPSSFFFDAKRAYQRRYSLTRIEEASDFIATSANNADHVKASSDPSICVGIATVQRNDAEYFDLLVGSLLDGLSNAERSDILLLPFIANIDPHTHYAYNTSWLPNLSDEIITYENVSARDKARMRSQETPKGHMKKALFDYSFMLQKCLDSKAPYMLMLEDDVIAADGWYRRTKAALADMESRSDYTSSVYLRLFYNTRIQGWNSEFWPHYLFWSVVFEILLVGVLWLLRRSNAAAAKFLTPRAILAILFICSPACVALYFAAGRLTVHPNPTGIHRMNSYGCCSQALLFPRDQVPPLLDYFKKKRTGLRDELIETYANQKELTRWALTPSVFQHIGSRSSKWRGKGSDVFDENGLISTERIWNYHFESWDADRLRNENRYD
jgi:GR25 family glycosyltransferase involved in LPS biosynthesis